MPNEATIKIRRQWSLFGGAIGRFTLFVDNKDIQALGNGEEKCVALDPGTHTICLRGASWLPSKQFHIAISEGEQIFLECGVATPYVLGQISIIIAIFMVTFFRTKLSPIVPYQYIQFFVYTIAVIFALWTLKTGKVYYLKEVDEF